jgi:hypothetical protein
MLLVQALRLRCHMRLALQLQVALFRWEFLRV